MLPLSIYLSAEFSVLDLRTLYRAVEHYLYMPDRELEEALESMLLRPVELHGDNDLPTLEPVNLYEPIDPAEANRNFNQYLIRSQLGGEEPLIIYPQHLHPRFDTLLFPRIEKDLLKRIMPLIPESQARQVYLGPIDEDRLTAQLKLLSTLLHSDGNSNQVGICISSCSKRAIPALGWLQKLAATEDVQIPVCLMRAEKLEPQVRSALVDALPDYPMLRSTALIEAQYRYAFEFLASGNASHLKPLLIDPPPDLQVRANSYGWPCFSATHWSEVRAELDLIPAPLQLYSENRLRAPGFMLSQPGLSHDIASELESLQADTRPVQAVINGTLQEGEETRDIFACHDVNLIIGQRIIPSESQVREALAVVEAGHEVWDLRSTEERSQILLGFAQLISDKSMELATLLSYETGKPIKNALNEVRDAIDLAYYYCNAAKELLADRQLYADEDSTHRLELHGRGVFLAIPSAETPVAELVGSGTAALVAGNALVVKPAENASLTSMRVFELLLQALVPKELIAFLPGGLREIGKWLLEDYRVSGVIYTGLGVKGSQISAQLANRPGTQLIPISVNSEGQSLAIFDRDQEIHRHLPRLLRESFSSASQYPLCSHVIYLEEEIADQFETTIINALPLISVGSPLSLTTDLGPVSSIYRLNSLHDQIERMRAKGRILAEQESAEEHQHGLYVAPTVIRLYTLDELQEVIPGPLLYLIRFNRDEIDRVLNEINRTGYGLSLSVYSENPALLHKIERKVRVGNLNFNHPEPRASAGALPIGGTGPSGTGPQIGGPNYLKHFTSERTIVTYKGV